ncbi:MAG: glycoside hydrolase family 20 zincin-like fold domain-containing protein [Aliidongia sp.]
MQSFITRPEQLARGPKDKLPSETPVLTYEQNAGLSLLPAETLGRITPEPANAVYPPGEIAIGAATKIRHPTALAGEAQLLRTALASLATGHAAPGTAAIELVLDPGLALPGFAEQGYMLEIGAAGVRIAGRTAQGVFHGIQSVLHLLPGRRVAGAAAEPDPALLPGHGRAGLRLSRPAFRRRAQLLGQAHGATPDRSAGALQDERPAPASDR